MRGRDRIVDPEIAETLAYTERRQRDKSGYWLGFIVGNAALGNEPYLGMLRLAGRCAAQLSPAQSALAARPSPETSDQ